MSTFKLAVPAIFKIKPDYVVKLPHGYEARIYKTEAQGYSYFPFSEYPLSQMVLAGARQIRKPAPSIIYEVKTYKPDGAEANYSVGNGVYRKDQVEAALKLFASRVEDVIERKAEEDRLKAERDKHEAARLPKGAVLAPKRRRA